MNYIARAEGLLPASFYLSYRTAPPFNQTKVNFPEEIKAAEPLLKRAHDLRLLAILTKFHALNRDLPHAVQSLETIAELIGRYWDEVHPRPEDGDVFLAHGPRCKALDDRPHTVDAARATRHFLSARRSGPISMRSLQLSSGEVKPREGEKTLEAGEIEQTIAEADLAELIKARDIFARLFAAVRQIRDTWIERAGYDQAVRYDNLRTLRGEGAGDADRLRRPARSVPGGAK